MRRCSASPQLKGSSIYLVLLLATAILWVYDTSLSDNETGVETSIQVMQNQAYICIRNQSWTFPQ